MDYETLRENLTDTLTTLEHLVIGENFIEVNDSFVCAAGGYGDVYRATLKGLGHAPSRSVAVKELRATGDDATRIRLAIRLARELRVWAKLKHPNVLELVGYYLNTQMTIARLVSPFMANGNIEEYLKKTAGSVSNAFRLKLLTDALKGLVYLHSSNPPICHADIKPENVLITDWLEAVLCDFGLARLADGQPSGLTTTRSIKGSLRYMSPELLDEDPVHTFRSDVWAYGCLVFKVMTDLMPYSTARSPGQVMVALALKEPPASLDNVKLHDERLRTLLVKCWDPNPSTRPRSSDCLSYLTKFVACVLRQPSARAVGKASLAWQIRDIPCAVICGDASRLAIVHTFSSATALSVHEFESGNILDAVTRSQRLRPIYVSVRISGGGNALILQDIYSSIYVWPLEARLNPKCIGDLPTSATSIVFSRDSAVMAYINLLGSIEFKFWPHNIFDPADRGTHTALTSFWSHSSAGIVDPNPQFLTLAITPDGSLLAASRDCVNRAMPSYDIEIIDVKGAKLLGCLKGHQNPIVSLEFSQNGALLQSTTRHQEVKFWDTSNLEALCQGSNHHTFTAVDHPCLATFPPRVSFDGCETWWRASPDFKWVTRAESSGGVEFYNLKNGEVVTLGLNVGRTKGGKMPMKEIMVLFATDVSGTVITQDCNNQIKAWTFEMTET